MQNISNQDMEEDVFYLNVIPLGTRPGSSTDSQCAVTNWDLRAGVSLMSKSSLLLANYESRPPTLLWIQMGFNRQKEGPDME